MGLHEAHHSSPDLNLSVSFRQGWFMSLIYIATALPFVFLFKSLNLPAGFDWGPAQALLAVYQVFIHSGSHWTNKYLSKIFILPGDHARHHELAQTAQNSNYGTTLSVFDHIFGTFCKSRPRIFMVVRQARIKQIYLVFSFLQSQEALNSC